MLFIHLSVRTQDLIVKQSPIAKPCQSMHDYPIEELNVVNSLLLSKTLLTVFLSKDKPATYRPRFLLENRPVTRSDTSPKPPHDPWLYPHFAVAICLNCFPVTLLSLQLLLPSKKKPDLCHSCHTM